MRPFVSNAGWVLAEQIGVNLLGLGVMVVLARSLGAAEFGIYAYVMSMAAVAATLGMMGLDGVLTRELVRHPTRQNVTMGTVAVLRMAGYGLGAAILLIFGLSQPQHGHDERMLFGITAVAVVLGGMAPMLATWLRAREIARPAAVAALVGAVIGGVAKIAVAGVGLAALGAANAGAAALAVLLLLLGYLRQGGPPLRGWRFDAGRARELLSESLVLFIGGLLATAYMNMDMAMVRLIAGPEASGTYAVPSRLIQAAQVLPAAISVAVFPRLVAAHGLRNGSFETQLRLGFSAVTLVAYGLILASAVAGGPVVALVFGRDWGNVGLLLTVMSLSLPLAFMRYMVTRWIILERQARYLLWSEGLGAVVNLGLNLLLIPRIGPMGAAIATLVAYGVAGPLSLMIWPQGRPVGRMLLRSLVDPVSPLVAWWRSRKLTERMS